MDPNNNQNNPNWGFTRFQNPRFQNPRFQNPRFQNPQFQNPQFQNPQFLDPQFQNSHLYNPQFQETGFQNTQFQETGFQNPQFHNPNDPVFQDGSFQQLLNFGNLPNQSDDDEVVPETQPEQVSRSRSKKPAKRRHKKKEADAQKGKVEKIKWSDREEVKLSESWASTSEDPRFGRDRSSPLFWEHVREKFFKKMHQYDPDYVRTADMISSKWRDLSRKVKKFNGYMQKAQQTRRSGVSDQMLVDEAKTSYRDIIGVPFPHYNSWEILRHSPVCQEVPILGGSSKRSKTSESSSPATPQSPWTPLNDDDDDDDDDDDVEEVPMFMGDLPRAPGRDRTKAAARKGKGKAGPSSTTETQLEIMTKKFGEFNETAQEKLRAKALKTIMADISHLQEPYRTIAEKEKARLVQKYFSDL